MITNDSALAQGATLRESTGDLITHEPQHFVGPF